MATIKNSILFLSSGRQVPISCGNLIIHLTLELRTGWSSDFLVLNKQKIPGEQMSEVSNPYNLTKEDIHEAADYMINLCMKLKDNVRSYGLESAKVFNAE